MSDKHDPEDDFAPDGKYGMLSNVEQGYIKLDRAMWQHYENRDLQCDEIAERLLLVPELPMIWRVRALIILSTIRDNSAVIRARKAYELMDVDVRRMCQETGTHFPIVQFEMAKEALEYALEVEEELKTEADGPTDPEVDPASIAAQKQDGSTLVSHPAAKTQAKPVVDLTRPQGVPSTVTADEKVGPIASSDPATAARLMQELSLSDKDLEMDYAGSGQVGKLGTMIEELAAAPRPIVPDDTLKYETDG